MSDFAEDSLASVKVLASMAAEFGLGYVTLDTDAVCSVLGQLADAKAELDALKRTRPCGRDATHPAHGWMFGRHAYRCAGVEEPVERDAAVMVERGGLVCGRCGRQTGNNNRGHYWSHCSVTGTTREFHFCCPGDCELESKETT